MPRAPSFIFLSLIAVFQCTFDSLIVSVCKGKAIRENSLTKANFSEWLISKLYLILQNIRRRMKNSMMPG